MKHRVPILFAIGTAVCWGLYGPTLQKARHPEGLLPPDGWSAFKPYVGIGLAYLVLAIFGGLIMMRIKRDTYSFSGKQAPALKWGFAAGILGALGALCLTSAMTSFEGPPHAELVMPIVFGGAVTVVGLHAAISHGQIRSLMAVGMVLTGVGIVLVAANTPHQRKAKSGTPDVEATVEPDVESSLPVKPILFALGTALCWGFYGPTLQHSRAPGSPPAPPPEGWSPFKPYVGIGLAYLVLAIVGGLVMMKFQGDSFSFTGDHSNALTWGFAAGCLGALGALSLTSAMSTFTGKPIPELVMPIVFGGAVTIVGLYAANNQGDMSIWMAAGILLTGVGIVLVAGNTPHGPGHRPTPPDPAAVQSSIADEMTTGGDQTNPETGA